MMFVFSHFILLLVSLYLLAKFAEFTLQSLLKVAHILKLSSFFVAFIVLGTATSIPELMVGINSAINKTPQLSLGNLMGETIVLLTLTVSITAIVAGKVKINNQFGKYNLLIMIVVLLLPIILLHDHVFSRLDAFIVIAAYAFYVIKIYKDRHNINPATLPKKSSQGKLVKPFLSFILGFAGIAIAANFAVDRAVDIGLALNIPILLIGVVVFSIGTNFPELVIVVAALRKKEKSLVAGNILGSAATNSLVLAIVAIIHPIEIKDLGIYTFSAFFFVAAVLLFSFFISSRNDITRLEGLMLLSLYSFFLITALVIRLI
jgi:cation:H+ antiporter